MTTSEAEPTQRKCRGVDRQGRGEEGEGGGGAAGAAAAWGRGMGRRCGHLGGGMLGGPGRCRPYTDT